MAASIVAAASAKSTNLTDVTSLTISKPTGTAQGDFMVAIVCTYNTTISAPAGWTTVDSQVSGDSNMKSYFFTKFAGASEASTYQFTWSGGASAAGGIITYRDTSGLSAVGTGTNPAKASATTTDPVTPPAVSNLTNPGFGSMALCWHDNGSTGVTATGSGTEYWDQSTTDGSPSTHERGTAGYSGGNAGLWKAGAGFNFSPSASGFSINPTGSITSSVAWTWVIADEVYSTAGASTAGAPTSSGTGSVSSNPVGSGTSTLGGVTDSGSGYKWTAFTGGSSVGKVTSSGQGAMIPKGSGTSTLGGGVLGGGVTSAGTVGVAGTRLEIKVDGEWVDITPKLRHSEGVTITRGKSSSGSKTTTTSCSFRLDNREHEFNPFNVSGAYYGALNRNTEIRMTKQEVGVRFWGEISSYEFGTDQSGNDLFVDVQCAGLLRRLEQGEAPSASAIRRDLIASAGGASTLHAYWPMEEEAGATQFAEVGPSLSRADRSFSPPMRIDQLGDGYAQLSSYSEIPASLPIPQIGRSVFRTGTMYGNMNDDKMFTFLLASPGGMTADTSIMYITGTDTNGRRMQVRVTYKSTDTWEIGVDGYDSGGVAYGYANNAAFSTVGQTGIMFYVYMDAGNLYLYGQHLNESTNTLITSMGSVINDTSDFSITINPKAVALSDASSAYIGHVAVRSGNFLISSVGAFDGEEAHTRFARLCSEEDITCVTVGTSSKRMGPQRPGALTELLRQCEATDGGIMYELRDDFGLGYRCLSTLYNQDAAVELDYEGGHLLNEFKPTYDDQDVYNDVTITREGGSSARYEITQGRMSTSASPTGIGRYDTSETLSLYRDEDAYPQAGWRAYKGSIDEVRVTKLSTGLEVPAVEGDDALTEQILTVDLGDRLTVANVPSWLGVRDDQLDQILDGYTERWDPTEHRWTYNTSPARPYQVARAKPTVGSGLRVGLPGGTFLGGGPGFPGTSTVSTTDTSIVIITTLPDFDGSLQSYLQVSDADGDFDIEIGGERMTVTAVADGGSFGASYTGHRWNLTVTRSVNGVVKAHDGSGLSTRVRLWDRPIIAL